MVRDFVSAGSSALLTEGDARTRTESLWCGQSGAVGERDDALVRIKRAGLSLPETMPAAVAILRRLEEAPIDLLDRLTSLDPQRFAQFERPRIVRGMSSLKIGSYSASRSG